MHFHLICILVLGVFGNSPMEAQADIENLVSNGSFEQYSAAPLGWFYTGQDYTRVMRYWESPTAASPDIYGPRVFVPSEWKEKGFGQTAAHSGKSMTGITVLGCEGGKPHCREYVQIQLTEPMVVGQRYAVSMWVKHLPLSVRIDHLDLAFVQDRVSKSDDGPLNLNPQLTPAGIVECSDIKIWQELTYEYTADLPFEYLVIGNFSSDDSTAQKAVSTNDHLNFGYYYVDDVSIVKLPPILEVPAYREDLSKAKLKQGETIQLHNIYFDHDRADFLPRSYRELNTLVEIMSTHPKMTIEVKGHTDNVGTTDYNYQLSLSRARAVVDYLVDHGVSVDRVSCSGYGSSKPMATNDSDAGRQVNRRVEFLILTK